VIHPQTDWTEYEAQHLAHTVPGKDYYFVLAHLANPRSLLPGLLSSSCLVVVGAYTDLESARVKRREYARGQVRVGRITPDLKGVLNVVLE
jgi:hypothetical protein